MIRLTQGFHLTAIAVIALSQLGGCDSSDAPEASYINADAHRTSLDLPSVGRESNGSVKEPLFDEVSVQSGIDFTHISGHSTDYRFCEVVGSGVALFDYDDDGDLDVYLVQGHEWERRKDRMVPKAPLPHDRLFRNDTKQGDSNSPMRFTDVTRESGLEKATGYGMGVACGDIDNDGDVDLYVTNFGPDQLWQNNGDGTFTEITESSGIQSSRWGTSAAFVDYDQDGLLDLYVCNYVNYTIDSPKSCFGSNGVRDYCGPNSYDPEPDKLFHNDGDGKFTDVSARSGVASVKGAGLGVVCSDFDDDGWTDIYVANDGMPNRLWINQTNGTFVDSALLSGCALNTMGAAEAGMGVDAGDFDRDGDEDLILAHLTDETNTLYINDGHGGFSDRTTAASLSAISETMTGFGIAWIDYDNDGWLDMIVANGTVKRELSGAVELPDFPLGQPNQLCRNLGRRFEDASAGVHPSFRLNEMSRGIGLGDLDNDGDMDFVIANNHGPVRVYRNRVGSQRRWIGFRLIEPEGRRIPIGATVRVTLDDGSILHRTVRRDGSYCCSRDPRVLIGVPEDHVVNSISIKWPDGTVQQYDPRPFGEYVEIGKDVRSEDEQ